MQERVFDEAYALITTNSTWPYEEMLRNARAWPGLMKTLNLPETR